MVNLVEGRMTINEIKLKIKFITPLLIHGANPREVDSVGLTGKALRGCWRFWFRAFVGGMIRNITKDKLFELESKVFGSSDENVGAKFRMVIEPAGSLEPHTTQINFSNRTVPFKGYKEGSQFLIRIIPRRNMDNDQINVLLASIWLWANLGAIGQRVRRGFGSPVIESPEPFSEISLPVKQEFNNSSELGNYLIEGLKKVYEIFKSWNSISSLENLNPPLYDASSVSPSNPPFFIISSFKQIAVAEEDVGDNVVTALNNVHGNSGCPELGSANPRRASPVFIRLHKVNNKFYPVVTWSKPMSSGCARNYILNNCKCKNYLDGSPV